MDRRRLAILPLFAALLLTTTLGLLACSSGSERPVLNQFFTASRLRDNTSLDSFSLVIFEPRTQGTVTSFTIEGVSPEQRRPLNIKTLAQANEEAKAADDEFTKRKQEYEDANMEAIRRVLKAERESAPLKGQDAEVQATWVKFRNDGVQISRRVSEARTKLASEKNVAERSIADPRNPVDLTKYDGELASKDVTVSAQVRLPTGETTQKTLIVTMERVILKSEKPISGHWIITNVKDTAAAAGTKTS